jgi:hypothetical protein
MRMHLAHQTEKGTRLSEPNDERVEGSRIMDSKEWGHIPRLVLRRDR